MPSARRRPDFIGYDEDAPETSEEEEEEALGQNDPEDDSAPEIGNEIQDVAVPGRDLGNEVLIWENDDFRVTIVRVRLMRQNEFQYEDEQYE